MHLADAVDKSNWQFTHSEGNIRVYGYHKTQTRLLYSA